RREHARATLDARVTLGPRRTDRTRGSLGAFPALWARLQNLQDRSVRKSARGLRNGRARARRKARYERVRHLTTEHGCEFGTRTRQIALGHPAARIACAA